MLYCYSCWSYYWITNKLFNNSFNKNIKIISQFSFCALLILQTSVKLTFLIEDHIRSYQHNKTFLKSFVSGTNLKFILFTVPWGCIDVYETVEKNSLIRISYAFDDMLVFP